ncbi:DUF3027 domain-containing protein [Microbacterium oleivorans]|uniref:DUF3027 domain-containing protein n=1 Tax=Microbacterium oleivorans TaxID=273677 RepID=UPI000B0C4C6C|nr:DUF3027 domain-containing protein [Microbacterium oleivorans]
MTSMPEQPSEAELPAEAEQPAAAEQPAEVEQSDAAEPAAVEEPESAPDEPIVVDERLFHAHDLARAALREVTPESTIGEAAGYVVEDGGVVSLRFANRMDGYPGWFWTVSVAVVEGAEPTVLEVELLPGDGALLAPEWLPWAERLAEYQAAQAAAGEDDESEDDEDDDASDEDEDDAEDADDLDAADFDSDGSPILHAGDVDGVDIDELDDTAADAEQTADDAEPDDDDESVDEGDDEDDESRESLREY